ncbi:erythromycin esterase family protein [Brachybacterium kimchii]|uniref:Erythromycin esterase family protein n=1 Tax=Brachybacterium kimchii TaxID=2942909 RepID=A0ABY4N143_9MICO|nr:erythromycin esterase family protein [Brachybacterium kimchii]UQN28263.1 erythromycin esterase family protein [Brachybacterium kimchii]
MNVRLTDRILPLVQADGVLGLGEPTHGSANAFSWKFDVICELASRGLLGAVAFEDSYILGTRVDEALRHGGDLAEPWRDALSLWRTTTISEGIARLQSINATLPAQERVRFLGIDSKPAHHSALALLDAGAWAPPLRRIARREPLVESELDETRRACRHFARHRDPHTSAAARQLLRYIDVYLAEPDLQGLHRRDTHMAETLLESRPHRGITVVWAHNEHVARNPDNFGGPSMGQVLHSRIGTRYTSIGILCGEGACRAVDPSSGDKDYRSVPLPTAGPNTTEAALKSLRADFVTAAEFTHPGPRRFIGWKLDSSLTELAARREFELHRPSTDFDAIVYLPSSVADASMGHGPVARAGDT